ncbi:hypothetical protein ACFWFF_15945 [Streptomyces sp. NPDC060223]|uniref:hypothetical protein n=1 Tax=unclassified Streptomyces TaxID=2593676 RepID=UPI003632A53D
MFNAPSVPLGFPGGTHSQGLEQTETTRLLSAATYLRPDSTAEFRTWQKRGRAKLQKKLTPEFVQKRLDKKQRAQKDADAGEVPEKSQPKVIIGHGYVRWVRNRVAVGRPVPAFGLQLTPVIERCAAAEDLLYLRRAVMTLAVLAGLARLRTTAAELAPFVMVVGLWAAFVLLDLTAQQRLDDTDGRTVARTTLEQILTKCDGVPGLVALVSSALALIATFA